MQAFAVPSLFNSPRFSLLEKSISRVFEGAQRKKKNVIEEGRSTYLSFFSFFLFFFPVFYSINNLDENKRKKRNFLRVLSVYLSL